MNDASYHKTVADYYDEEAHSFEERAHTNPLLGHLRQRFRDVVLEGETSALLEIGYGPGLDMVWFAQQDGVSAVHGLDITPNFHEIVSQKAKSIEAIRPYLGGPEQCLDYLEEGSIDTVYVFFGALNTCANLDSAAEHIARVLKPGGRAVLTFVNKWYMFDVAWNLLTLRPKKAIARLKKVWTGYSPTRQLDSRCYSSREVNQRFSPHLRRTMRRGYCITHPAWYRHHWAPLGSLRSRFLMRFDRWLRWTPFWNLGEYSLYVYERPEIKD
ncbi:class I SAM-dependent methyltransferase [Candidatus Poseidonia alphae]|nr:class I SAM-dependent methyltransferase [Candidatus Poseidonia alphae]